MTVSGDLNVLRHFRRDIRVHGERVADDQPDIGNREREVLSRLREQRLVGFLGGASHHRAKRRGRDHVLDGAQQNGTVRGQVAVQLHDLIDDLACHDSRDGGLGQAVGDTIGEHRGVEDDPRAVDIDGADDEPQNAERAAQPRRAKSRTCFMPDPPS